MFCAKCGAKIQEGSNVCSSCGSTLPKHKHKKWHVVVGAIIGVIAAAIILNSIPESNDYKATVEQYVEAYVAGDAKKIVALMPKEYVKAAIDNGDYDSKSDMIDDYQKVLDYSIEAFDEYFGKRWKYDISIIDTYEYSADEVDMYLYYNDYANMDAAVDSIMEVSYMLSIYSNKEEGSTTETLILFEIDGKWYVANTYF